MEKLTGVYLSFSAHHFNESEGDGWRHCHCCYFHGRLSGVNLWVRTDR